MATASVQPRGALERQVLACFAATPGPLTVGDVLRDLSADLAYTTVLTTLTRLHAKGVLSRQLHGRAYAYSLNVDQDDIGTVITAHRMRRLLEAGEDRAGVLARFVADLSPEDENLLAAILQSPDPRGSS